VIDTAPALELNRIEKSFGTVRALSGASLSVTAGSVHALLGENGAGKTTLMRIAYGMEAPDGGMLRIRGRPVRLRAPADAIANGIGMVHQHFTLVPAMTVVENIALGGRGIFDTAKSLAGVESLTRKTGLALDPNARVSELSVTAQQRLELLKLLARDATILILDEPTAVLAPSEADDLLRLLRGLADGGRAVVLITHKLREALQIADHVTVLRHGITTLQQPCSAVHESLLIEAMLGKRELDSTTAVRTSSPGPAVIRANELSVADAAGTVRVRAATFTIRTGEIVGVAAVEGSGHRELLRAIAGRLPIAAGTLEGPSAVGFVPDDRLHDGLVLPMSLSENFALKNSGARRGLIRWRDISSATRQIMRDFDVRAESDNVAVSTLSGGNQQRFVLGRELADFPTLVVAENPTRGLDIQASTYVRDRLIEACARGVAIVLHSADLDEMLSIADRMLVVFAGTVREVPVDAGAVGRAMLGAA
jgi:general nucleoside transport system ATP-binding protein